jgi:hypothetical protein
VTRTAPSGRFDLIDSSGRMKAMSNPATHHYCVQCTHPIENKIGCWVFLGESHRTGIPVSPLFGDLYGLYEWMRGNGWKTTTDPVWNGAYRP